MNGGTAGFGTVYSINPDSGAETVIYSFSGPPSDGQAPGGLIYKAGSLYGTTSQGGKHGQGTLFKVDLSTNTEIALYDFHDSGSTPVAAPAFLKGELYGTSWTGSNGDGSIFQVNAVSGRGVILHHFRGGLGGGDPTGVLAYQNGYFYSTTQNPGTIFEFRP